MKKCKMLLSLILVTCCCVGFAGYKHFENDAYTNEEKITDRDNKYVHANLAYITIKNKYPKESQLLNKEAFVNAYLGAMNIYQAYPNTSKSNLLTLCDFSLSANEKRLWIIDINSFKILKNSLVSHGRNSGEEYANTFSNKMSSYQSSLGFYLTSNTYDGSNGYSLKLIGLDKSLNDNAEARAIVMHGADYCSEAFIAEHGRLGRSLGCPSVPIEEHKEIIDIIKDHSVLYIYHSQSKNLLASSKWIKNSSKLLYAAEQQISYDTNSVNSF